jgi:hypothetical protein
MRNRARLRRSILLGACVWVFCLVFALAGTAQEKGQQDGAKPDKDAFGFAQSQTGMRISAAMQVFAAPNPVVLAANRIMAVASAETGPVLFPEWDLTIDAPLPLSEKALSLLRDDTPIPNKAKHVWELTPDERAYWAILDEALIASKLVPPELFKKAATAEENEYVTFDHLFNHTEQWRGKVVPVKGKLLRIRKWRPSQQAQAAGVEYVYEGFVAGETPHRPPFWILFTTLPEGLKVQETMSQPITFYGYFIKRVQYPAEKVDRRTNLLIGPTLYLDKKMEPAAPETPFTRQVLFIAAGGLFAMAVLIFTMHWWFHRGDRKIHSRLAEMRDKEPFALSDDEPAEPAESQPPGGIGTPEPRNGT